MLILFNSAAALTTLLDRIVPFPVSMRNVNASPQFSDIANGFFLVTFTEFPLIYFLMMLGIDSLESAVLCDPIHDILLMTYHHLII